MNRAVDTLDIYFVMSVGLYIGPYKEYGQVQGPE